MINERKEFDRRFEDLTEKRQELRDRMGLMRDEVEGFKRILDEGGTLTDGQRDRLNRQGQVLNDLEAEHELLSDKQRAMLREGKDRGFLTVYNGDNTPARPDLDGDPIGEPRELVKFDIQRYHKPWEILESSRLSQKTSVNEWRARALSAIEKMPGANYEIRKAATEIVEEFDNDEGDLSKLALVLSDPNYLKAFGEKLRQGENAILSEREVQAVRRVRSIARAMSLTDNTGGYLVPFQLDPSVILTSDGSMNDIRKIARRVVATGDVWNGVSSPAVSWSWDTEASEVSDDATTFAQPTVTVFTGRGFVPFSIEVGMDGANLTEEVGKLLAAGKDDLESVAFATGNGTSEPRGIITALQGTAPPVIAATTNDSFGKEDIYLVDQALPARYRPRSSWLANRSIYNRISQFETANGARLFPDVHGRFGEPGSLLGRGAFESEAMDGALGTGNDYVLVFGDFENYVIADRIGMNVEFVPHLFHTSNNRPSGQRGLYAWYRTGGNVVNAGGFKLLRV